MASALLSIAAQRDFHAISNWISEDSPQAAVRFQRSVLRAAQHIGNYPMIGVARPDWSKRPLRILPLRRFPYVLVYDSNQSPTMILRILHTARDLPNVLGEREPE
jgi:toxin ParE1/3/4